MRDAKNKNNFDSYIRQELEQLTPDMKMGSWDKLSQRMDTTEQADAFDEKASKHLSSMHVPYQKNSWGVLAERLTLERDRLQAVMHYKAMELSLFLLLLITFWQHIPINNTDTIQKRPASYPIASIELNANKNKPVEDNNTVSIGKTTGVAVKSSTSEIENTSFLSGAEIEDHTNQSVLVQKIASVSQYFVDERKQQASIVPLNPLPSIDALSINTTHDAQTQLKEHQANKADNLSSPSDVFRQDGALTALDGKELSFLDYGKVDDLLSYIRPSNRKTFFRVGFFGSPDYNHVITPLQTVGNGTIAEYDSYSLSYSGGITLGIERGKWEMELGAIYEARNYQAIPTVHISGNITEGYTALSLRDIELNTMNLPLRFRRNFIMHDKWRVYALAGVSLNVVLSANYYTVEPKNITTTRPVGSSGTSRVVKPLALQNQNLTNGLLEGGDFWENSTLYTNLGLGVERYMSYRWSIFAQPTMQLAVPFFNEGLGPYDDTIDNFGVNIGLKVRL